MAKVDLYPDFREFLKLSNFTGVKHPVLGGYSVIHYGYERSTADLDVWVALDTKNLGKVSKALRSFAGFSAKTVSPKRLNDPGRIFKFGREPVRINILTKPDGVDFDKVYAARSQVLWDGIKVNLIGFEDLLINKRASGRAKDIADLENLPAPKTRRTGSRG